MNKFELKCRIKVNIDSILCILILNDGTIAIGSNDSSIKLFNSKKYHNFLTIKEHKKGITSLAQSNKLKFKNIISASKDSRIIIFEFSETSYKIIQILNHNKKVNKILELKNNIYNFSTCSDDGILNLYNINNYKNEKEKENKIIKNEFNFNFNDIVFTMIETKNNEIAVILSSNYHCLKFIDTENKIIKKSIQQISIIGNNSICLFNNKYLIIGGSYMITIIDIFNYSKEIIDINSWKIYSINNINEEKKYISYCDDEGNIFFNEIIINETGLSLIEKFHYINCYSTAIFTIIYDNKSKIFISGGIESDINIFNVIN